MTRVSTATAVVDRRPVEQSSRFHGKIAPTQTMVIHTAKSKPSGVITELKKRPGDVVNNGDELIEVDGRPVFVFQGAVPAYQDMTVSSPSSKDVAQLERTFSVWVSILVPWTAYLIGVHKLQLHDFTKVEVTR